MPIRAQIRECRRYKHGKCVNKVVHIGEFSVWLTHSLLVVEGVDVLGDVGKLDAACAMVLTDGL